MSVPTSTQRYRSNPDYRARVIARVTARHTERKNDPNYRKLVNIRKKIWDRRDSIDRFQRRIETLELDLLALIRRRDKLAARLKTNTRTSPLNSQPASVQTHKKGE